MMVLNSRWASSAVQELAARLNTKEEYVNQRLSAANCAGESTPRPSSGNRFRTGPTRRS